MKPELAQFGSKSPIPVIELNVDQRETSDFKKYADKMTSRSIPFTILVDAKGTVVHKISGYRTSSELVKETQKFVK